MGEYEMSLYLVSIDIGRVLQTHDLKIGNIF